MDKEKLVNLFHLYLESTEIQLRDGKIDIDQKNGMDEFTKCLGRKKYGFVWVRTITRWLFVYKALGENPSHKWRIDYNGDFNMSDIAQTETIIQLNLPNGHEIMAKRLYHASMGAPKRIIHVVPILRLFYPETWWLKPVTIEECPVNTNMEHYIVFKKNVDDVKMEFPISSEEFDKLFESYIDECGTKNDKMKKMAMARLHIEADECYNRCENERKLIN